MDSSVGDSLKAAFGTKDLYKILNLEVTATVEDIKKAYRKVSMSFIIHN